MARLSVVGSERESASERVAARIAAEENRGLLRFLTCGSVDDGKSTLIGRLLLRFCARLRGSAQKRRAGPAASGLGEWTARSVASCRRARGRARAEASPSTSPTAISRRRGGNSSSPTRRAMCSTRATWRPAPRTAISPCCWSMRGSGVLDPDAAPCLHPVIARHPQDRARDQQDGSRRFRSGALRGDRRRLFQLRRAAAIRPGDLSSRLGAQGRQRDPPECPYALVSRADFCSAISRRSISDGMAKSVRSASRCNG